MQSPYFKNELTSYHMKPISPLRRALPGMFFLALLLTPLVVAAQTRLRDIAQRDATTGWIYFNPGVGTVPETFFATFQPELGLSEVDHLMLVRSWTDNIGMTHHLFRQFHGGVPVEDAAMLLHERQGELVTANGQIAAGLQVSNHPSIGADLALQRSLQEIGASAYAWEDQALEAQLQAGTDSPDTSWYPKPELLYVRIDRSKQFSADNMVLAYRTFIFATEPFSLTDVYVDAQSGLVLYRQSRINECVPGTGWTNYYGVKNIDVGPLGSNYTLQDNCRGLGVNTYSGTFGNVTSSSTAFSSATQNQNSAHWCAENTFDYFLNIHSRNGYNGAGAIMNTRTGGNGVDACWDQVLHYVWIKDGNGGLLSNSLATLDVVGHEWTHAYTQFNGNGGLNYTYESGALNESFSDIFGTMVEFYAAGGYGDYFIADECWVPGGMLRNMKDPKFKGQPDTYHGVNWYYLAGDNGGVHTNSGVPNHWFYLLAEGSSATDGVNDIPVPFTVSGIGRAKAAAIAFRTLTTYLTPTSNFYAARAGSIRAATDLYGANSNEVCQVANAWFAVGIGNDNLVIKDNLADSGAEPSNGINMYMAYDIWVRQTPDFFNSGTGHYQNEHVSQNLMATVGPNPSYVYVKIHNTGNVPSHCGTLKMYWSRASTGLTWPINWTNNFPCPGFGICGNQFTACGSTTPIDFPIPSIPAGQDYTVQITWCPPDPTFLPGTGNPTDDSHFCLLARIERENDPMHDEQLNVSCNYNTWQNNNIAWKNIQVQPSNGVYLVPSELKWMCVRARRVVDNGRAIQFRIQDDKNNPFRVNGDILVRLPDSLFNRWLQGGKKATGLEHLGGQLLKLTEPTGFLDGIDLPMGQDYSICLAFNPFEGLPIDALSTYVATMEQLEETTPAGPHEVVGGEGFELRINPYPIWLGYDQHICKGDSVLLTADLSNWNVNDSTFIFWDNGQTGPSILVAPDSSQTFTATVTNGDGQFASAFVNIYVANPTLWFLDADGDGYGTDVPVLACQPPAGYVDNHLDCDDHNNNIHPGAPEICNGVDDNCNGQADEGLNFVQSWRDSDADGFGDPATGITACTVPQGYVFNNTDCDDENPAVYPGAAEVCNGIDDNCNGQVDEGFVCYTTSAVFDGLTYSAISHAGLLLSGDSLIIANTAIATDTFSVQVDVHNSIGYNLWYSASGVPGAVIVQNAFGKGTDGTLKSLGKTTLTQVSADEFKATVFIPDIDTLQMKVYRNDTLVYEAALLNGDSIDYQVKVTDGGKPKYDVHIGYINQPGDRPPLVVKVLTGGKAEYSVFTPGGEVLCDAIQFSSPAAKKDTVSLSAVSYSATGFPNLIFYRAIAVGADQLLMFCAGDTLNLSATTADGAQYQWQKDLIDIPGAVFAQYQALETGDYRVKVTTGSTTYTSRPLPVQKVDCSLSTHAINPLGGIRISPNPNTGVFSVELPAVAVPGMVLRITDLAGRPLLEKQTETGSAIQQVWAGNLAAGVYFLQLVSEGKVLALGKFVRQ